MCTGPTATITNLSDVNIDNFEALEHFFDQRQRSWLELSSKFLFAFCAIKKLKNEILVFTLQEHIFIGYIVCNEFESLSGFQCLENDDINSQDGS